MSNVSMGLLRKLIESGQLSEKALELGEVLKMMLDPTNLIDGPAGLALGAGSMLRKSK